MVNYEDNGVPDEQHLLVARVTGRGGVDLHTRAALEEYLEGRHYEQLFTWPEQGLGGLPGGQPVNVPRVSSVSDLHGPIRGQCPSVFAVACSALSVC